MSKTIESASVASYLDLLFTIVHPDKLFSSRTCKNHISHCYTSPTGKGFSGRTIEMKTTT